VRVALCPEVHELDTHFEGADIEGYLNSSTGLSDRLHRQN
jgi:hypothetical protein